MNKKATITEVAEAAGVSIASISRALNGKEGLSEKTRKHILNTCNKLGYIPDRSAIQLVSGETNVIGIYFARKEDMASRYTAVLLPYLTESLSQAGLTPLPVVPGITPPVTFRAVILIGLKEHDQRIIDLTKARIPFVSIGWTENGYSVSPNDKDGISLAVQHLASQGKSKIAFVTPNLDELVMTRRYDAYREAIDKANLTSDCIFIGEGASPDVSTYRYFNRLPTEAIAKYDGLICFSDEVAFAATQALKDRQYSIPQEIAIVGFDGIPGLSNDLTTLEQDFRGIAQQTVELIHKAYKQNKPEQRSIPVTLKVSKTTIS